jgi:glycosyltransferase involved in cell wall biosynthesis
VLIVGTGPAENSLRELAAAGNVPVVFYGACYDEPTLARLFAAANVTVSPGNVGLTCMHSLGYGVPVITHDDADAQMPEWEAITPGVTGDFFSRDAVNELADAIRRWTAAPRVSETTRRHCIRMVEERYHPRVQRQLFERAAECGLHDPSAARIASAADQLP